MARHDAITAPPAVPQAELVNQLAQELANTQRTLAAAQRRLGGTTRTLETRTQALHETRAALALLLSTLDTSGEGIMAVGHAGTVHCNAQFAQVWRMPAARSEELNESAVLALQLAQVRDPEGFLQLMDACKRAPEGESTCRVELTDGRLLAGRILAQRIRMQHVAWVGCWRELQA
jgi:hypothetical protein